MRIAQRVNARPSAWLASLLCVVLIAGCGGGGDGGGNASSAQSGTGAANTTNPPASIPADAGAPHLDAAAGVLADRPARVVFQ